MARIGDPEEMDDDIHYLLSCLELRQPAGTRSAAFPKQMNLFLADYRIRVGLVLEAK